MNKLLIATIGTIILVATVGFLLLKKPQSQVTSPNIQEQSQTPLQSIPGYTGKLLAGTQSPYLQFNQQDYGKAKAEEKIIFLNFYANWCPICRAETPIIDSGFNSLQSDKIVGFRVNFNDSETDDDEKNLAKEFNVPYQHTKIFLKNGQEISRSGEQWDKSKFDKAFSEALK